LQIIGQICAFEAPFGGLGATYDVHLRLIGKLVGDFLLVIIELLSLGAFVLSQYTRLTDGRMDGRTDRILTAIPWVYASYSRTVKSASEAADTALHQCHQITIITSTNPTLLTSDKTFSKTVSVE